MTRIASLAAAAVLFPAAAFAADCTEMIEQTAAKVPELGQGEPATQELGLSTEQVQAVLATLDAARLADQAGEAEVCTTLIGGAEDILKKGDAGPQKAGTE